MHLNSALSMTIAVLLLSGPVACRKQEAAPIAQKSPEKTFLVGLIPEQNLFRQMERYEPLAEYLSRKSGLKIKLTVLPRYRNIIDNFVQEGMDGAFFGSFTYVLAHAKLGVQVLARPEGLDGTSTYHGLIFVRRDSAIGTARQMAGKDLRSLTRQRQPAICFPWRILKNISSITRPACGKYITAALTKTPCMTW